MARSGADLALLLLGAFRDLASAATQELERQGYEDFRPVHDAALRAIAGGAASASELGRSLSVSKQAAAKTIATLEHRGLVVREADAGDARRKRLQVTADGFEVLRLGEAIFDVLRKNWEKKIGASNVRAIEKHLRHLLAGTPSATLLANLALEGSDGTNDAAKR